jgi:hypothetical protein
MKQLTSLPDPKHCDAIRIRLFTLMRIRIRLFTFVRIRILLLIEVIHICDYGSTDPSRLHFEPPCFVSLHGLQQLQKFDFDANLLPKMIRIRIRITDINRNFLPRNDISIEGAATLMINPATALRMIQAGINLGV